MERIDGVVGNVHADGELATRRAAHEAAGTLERLVLDAGVRRRSRFRATTDAGTDVGVVLDRPAVSAGDVLAVDDDRMIVVAFEPREALAIPLPEPDPEALEAAVELGHRIGNHHWELAVEDGTCYVPLEADRHVVERVVRAVLPEGEPRVETVDAERFLADSRGLHGEGHDHVDGHSHTDGHDHVDGSHAHDHADGKHPHADGSHAHDHADGEHAHADGEHAHAAGSHTHDENHAHEDHGE